jgi:hypothetical protein
MVADKDLSPLPGLIHCNILSGGLRPRLLSFRSSRARAAHSATEFRDRYWPRSILGARRAGPLMNKLNRIVHVSRRVPERPTEQQPMPMGTRLPTLAAGTSAAWNP